MLWCVLPSSLADNRIWTPNTTNAVCARHVKPFFWVCFGRWTFNLCEWRRFAFNKREVRFRWVKIEGQKVKEILGIEKIYPFWLIVGPIEVIRRYA